MALGGILALVWGPPRWAPSCAQVGAPTSGAPPTNCPTNAARPVFAAGCANRCVGPPTPPPGTRRARVWCSVGTLGHAVGHVGLVIAYVWLGQHAGNARPGVPPTACATSPIATHRPGGTWVAWLGVRLVCLCAVVAVASHACRRNNPIEPRSCVHAPRATRPKGPKWRRGASPPRGPRPLATAATSPIGGAAVGPAKVGKARHWRNLWRPTTSTVPPPHTVCGRTHSTAQGHPHRWRRPTAHRLHNQRKFGPANAPSARARHQPANGMGH